jgi:hypothetical protein
MRGSNWGIPPPAGAFQSDCLHVQSPPTHVRATVTDKRSNGVNSQVRTRGQILTSPMAIMRAAQTLLNRIVND